jgi:hypothetical protein
MAAAWVLVGSLVALRAEFNAVSPGRDKGADGSIGDSAHTSSSDHTPDEISDVLRDHDGDSKNEVHALDIDSSGPWPGSGTQKARFHWIVMRIIAAEKKKWLDAADRCRLEYVIWDGKIYSRSRDFAPVAYIGSDKHTNHAHFSGRYITSCEGDTRSWGVVVPVVPTEPEEDMGVEEVREGLEEARPYGIARIKDRGWAPTSTRRMVEYLFESLVASGSADVDGDGDVEPLAVQARLDRMETELFEIKRLLTDLANRAAGGPVT